MVYFINLLIFASKEVRSYTGKSTSHFFKLSVVYKINHLIHNLTKRLIMKKTLLAMMIVCFCTTDMIGQTIENIKIKVTNIPSSIGKILLLTDKGQYGMTDANDEGSTIEMKKLPIGNYKLNIIHDTNNNWILDMDENNIPIESCASVEVEITEETNEIIVELQDIKKRISH